MVKMGFQFKELNIINLYMFKKIIIDFRFLHPLNPTCINFQKIKTKNSIKLKMKKNRSMKHRIKSVWGNHYYSNRHIKNSERILISKKSNLRKDIVKYNQHVENLVIEQSCHQKNYQPKSIIDLKGHVDRY